MPITSAPIKPNDQNDPICTPELVIAEDVPAAPNAGYLRAGTDQRLFRIVTRFRTRRRADRRLCAGHDLCWPGGYRVQIVQFCAPSAITGSRQGAPAGRQVGARSVSCRAEQVTSRARAGDRRWPSEWAALKAAAPSSRVSDRRSSLSGG